MAGSLAKGGSEVSSAYPRVGEPAHLDEHAPVAVGEIPPYRSEHLFHHGEIRDLNSGLRVSESHTAVEVRA